MRRNSLEQLQVEYCADHDHDSVHVCRGSVTGIYCRAGADVHVVISNAEKIKDEQSDRRDRHTYTINRMEADLLQLIKFKQEN